MQKPRAQQGGRRDWEQGVAQRARTLESGTLKALSHRPLASHASPLVLSGGRSAVGAEPADLRATAGAWIVVGGGSSRGLTAKRTNTKRRKKKKGSKKLLCTGIRMQATKAASTSAGLIASFPEPVQSGALLPQRTGLGTHVLSFLWSPAVGVRRLDLEKGQR